MGCKPDERVTPAELESLVFAQLTYLDPRSYPVYVVRDEDREWEAMTHQAFESMPTPRGPWIRYDGRPYGDGTTRDHVDDVVDAYEPELRREIQDAEDARANLERDGEGLVAYECEEVE